MCPGREGLLVLVGPDCACRMHIPLPRKNVSRLTQLHNNRLSQQHEKFDMSCGGIGAHADARNQLVIVWNSPILHTIRSIVFTLLSRSTIYAEAMGVNGQKFSKFDRTQTTASVAMFGVVTKDFGMTWEFFFEIVCLRLCEPDCVLPNRLNTHRLWVHTYCDYACA